MGSSSGIGAKTMLESRLGVVGREMRVDGAGNGLLRLRSPKDMVSGVEKPACVKSASALSISSRCCVCASQSRSPVTRGRRRLTPPAGAVLTSEEAALGHKYGQADDGGHEASRGDARLMLFLPSKCIEIVKSECTGFS